MGKVFEKIALLDIKDGRVLVAHSKDRDVSFIPGGKRERIKVQENGIIVERWETDAETLIREIREEMGVQLIPDAIQYYGTIEDQAHDRPEGDRVRVIVYKASYSGDLHPGAEIDRLEYFDFSRINDVGSVLQKLFLKLKETGEIRDMREISSEQQAEMKKK